MIIFFALLVCLQLQTGDPWPEEPDFEQKIDYVKWFENRIRGEYSEAENAYELYEKIFPSLRDPAVEGSPELCFAGMHHDPDRVASGLTGPWDPTEHPRWEASYQKHRLLLEEFKKAAARPYCLLPRGVMFDLENDASTLLDIRLKHHMYIQSCVRGLSEAAWRADDGHIDCAAFVTGSKACLQAARQIEREPFVLSQLLASGIRGFAYHDLRCALHNGKLSISNREAVLDLLATIDKPPPAFECGLQGDLAGRYDFLQHAADKNGPAVGWDEFLLQTIPLIRRGIISATRTAGTFRAFNLQSAEQAVLPFSLKRMREMDDIGTRLGKTNLVTSILIPSVSRAYMIAVKASAEQRATRLVYEVCVYKDKHGRWPAELSDLKSRVPETLLEDPFSGMLFRYELRDGKPLLYCVGLDGDDDGGKHHKRWGERRGNDGTNYDGDYVFWPIPDVKKSD